MTAETGTGMEICRAGYGSADLEVLIAEIQQEYVRRYGGIDESPLEPHEFEPPDGIFLVGYSEGRPVAMGGWRRHDPAKAGAVPGRNPGEIRRMYVTPDARGRGYARRILLGLEESARAAGVDWLVLETGSVQPEAVSLYRACGYTDIPAFGYYRHSPQSIHLGKAL